MRPLRCILGRGGATVRKQDHVLWILGVWVVKWNQTFFTNTVLIIDYVSCLEQVFSLLSLRTKTA